MILMKKFLKTISIALALVLCLQGGMVAFATTTSGSLFDSKTYTHQARFDKIERKQGIDVSKHNGTVNWKKVKAAGVDFAIIRVGYRGYGSSGSIGFDEKFDENMKNATTAGVDIGVYFYSQSLNEAEAKAEANYVLSKIKPYKLQLPVVFDYEFAGVSTGRLDSAWRNKTINKTKMTANCLAFCNTVKAAGYDAMVYASKSFLLDNVDHTAIENAGYTVWLAHYITNTNYTGEYVIWQFSSTGKISGIDGSVDCNFMYYDPSLPEKDKFVISEIKDRVYTGSAIKPSFTVTLNGEELIKGEDYIVTYSNNTAIGTASITITGCNDYVDIPKKIVKFKIIPAKVKDLKFKSRTPNSITVSWSASPDTKNNEIWVYRSGAWKKFGTTTGTSFTVDTLYPSSTYSIRVLAYKTVNSTNYYSANSDIKDVTSPAKVTGLTTSSRSTTSITLKWTKQSYATKYRVYKYSPSKKSYLMYKDVTSGSTNTLKVTDLSANTGYKFKVRAYKQTPSGTLLSGELSSAYTAYTSPKPTTIKAISAPATKKLKLSWSKVSGVSGYQVMWSTTSDFSSNYKTVNVSGASTTSKTISLAQSKKKYYVKVRTYKIRDDKKIYSSWSAKKSITSK